MSHLANSSITVADDLRRAERSINIATRDVAQFIVTAIDAADGQSLSAAMSHGTLKAAAQSINLLVESQGEMAMRAHVAIEGVARRMGLDETSWGGSAPKPAPSVVARVRTH